ncbi:MAG TPA: SDR family oxidoreductase [Gemmataceae bacterium]
MGRRRKLEGLRVLVTGASQGIGRALAAAAARRGMRVLAAARSPDLLGELAREVREQGGQIETVRADVTSPEDRQKMVDAARQHFGGLDVLINNAGIGATGHFMDTEPETMRKIFEVNFFGTTETTRAFLPLLKEGTTPAIVNISSIVGRRALPARSHYSASKFAVQGFSEAIRAELDKDGIDVLVVNPGLTRTNFSENLLERKARMPVDHMRGMSADEVADATLDALARGKHEITLTFKGKMLVFVARFFPFVVDFFSKKKVRELFAEEIAEREKKRREQQAAEAAQPPAGAV